MKTSIAALLLLATTALPRTAGAQGQVQHSLLLNPAWQHSRDSSIVWGQVVSSSADPAFVAPGAIP